MPPTPESHPARYFAWLYSPPALRLVLEALFGIEAEIKDSLRPGIDHNVAHARLQWWREECGRCAAGSPVHPLTRNLVAAFTGAPPSATAPTSPTAAASSPPLPQLAGLSGFVDATVWDLAGATFESRRELTAYCERWSAAMIETIVAITSPPPKIASPSAKTDSRPSPTDSSPPDSNWRAVGCALRELELLTDLAREANCGRLRIPLDEIEHAAVNPSALAKPPWPAAMSQLLRERHQQLRAELARNLGTLNRQEQLALRGLLVWIWLASLSSRRAEAALPDSLRPRRFDAIADAWFAWSAARRATAGRFRLD
jgi:phytoene synthase